MARKSIKGLFVAVELDLTKLKQGVSTAVNTLTTEFEKAKDSIDKSLKLDTGAFDEVLTDVAKSINRVQNAIQTKSGGEVFSKFIKDNDEFKKSLESVATQAGVSSEVIRDSLSKAVKANQIKETVSAVRALGYSLNLSGEQLLQYAKSLGVTGEALEKLASHTDRLNNKSHGFFTELKNLMTGGNAMAALQSSLATLGANISIAGFTELGKSMVDTSIKVDSLRTAFTSIYKDADKAGMQLDYIRSVTDELGLEFYSTAEAAKGFFAAAETSTIKNNAEEIFHAFSAASSALKLSQEQTNGVFLAISQMMSKGKISAEEMRQQLAERLPGAVQLLAESMGVTLQELDKMFESGEVGIENLVKLAEKVEEVYGEAGVKASKALLGELNKLKSAWTDFKTEFIEQEVITDWVKKAQNVVAWLKDNIDELRKAVNSLVAAYLAFLALKAQAIFKEIAVFAGESVGAIRNLVKGTTTLKAAMASLSGAMTTATLGISALVGVIAYVWQTQKEEFDAAKYSIDDIRGSISATTNVMSELGEAVKSTDDRLKDLAKRKLELNVINAKENLKKVRNSLGEIINAANSYANSESFVKKVLPEDAKEDDMYENFAKVEASKAVFSTVITNLGKIKQALDENRISDEQAIAQLKEQENLFKSLGFEGTQAYTDLQAYITQFISAMKGASDAIQTQKQGLNDLASTASEVLGGTAFSGAVTFNKPKLAIDNLKKEFKKQGDFKLVATIDLLTSGDLSVGGEKLNADINDIKELLKIAKEDGKEGAKYLQESYNLSTEITKEIEKRAKLEQDKANAPILEKYKAFDNELKSVTAQLEDMAKASEHGPESVAYGLYKIEAKAERARKEVAGLGSKFKDIDPTKLKELQTLKLDLINKEEASAIEAYFQKYKDAGKEAYHQLKELNGETNSAELESTLAKYDKILVGLRAWKDKEYELHKGNTEKLKQVDAEYATYVEAIEAQKAEARLRHSTKWEDGVKLGWRQYEKTATVTAGKVSDVTLKAFQGMGDALANFVTSADMSWKSMGEAFSNLARSMINDITNIIAHATVMNGMKAMFGGTAFGSFLGMANGGVVNSGLSAYSNGVYNTPTFFNTNGGGIQRYANGGVFGEAGPEAIMPLTRMPNGRLGVAATGGGGGGGDVQVNVYNNSNSNAEVRQSTGSGGGKTIDVIIGDVVAKQMSTPGSKLNRTVTTYTGGQQAVTRR